MTEEEAAASGRRNLLTRALGTKPYTDFRFDSLPLMQGDRLLLCSDGLTVCCDDARISSILCISEEAKEAANALLAAALGAGAPDNVTVAVVDVN